MDEIIKIIFNCNKKRRLLSDDDVRKICFIILKKNKYNFVKEVRVFKNNPFDSECAGVYQNGNILFFLDEVIELIHRSYENFSASYNIDGSAIDIYNYFYLGIIFHELAHVRQYAIINGKRNCLEKKLFSIFLNLSQNEDFYNENYYDILTEVNANNVALVTTNYLYSKLPKNFITINDYRCYQSSLIKLALYNNYEILNKKDDIISPAERVVDNFDEEILFYLDMKLDDIVKLIYSNDNLTIYKKIMLGLPLTYLEYSYAHLLSDRLNVEEGINIVKKLQKRL